MRRLYCAALCVAFAVLVGGPAYAFGVDDTPGANLGGYIAQSSAEAFSLQPFFPALIPTGDVPVEGTVAYTTSNVRSGGNAFARGAALWMGSAASDPGPLIGQGAGQPELGEVFPKWPVQAQATQDDGVKTTGKAPVLLMTAEGFPDKSSGDTRMADVEIEGLLHIEHLASTSSSLVQDTNVTNTARVVLHGVTLLNGHITIDQLRSVSTTTSDGRLSSDSGNVVISGLRIGGVNVTVTDRGFQIQGLPKGSEDAPGAGGERFPGQSPADVVNAVLENLHARLTLFQSVGSATGGNAQRLGGALVLSIDNPAGGVGPVPPGRFDLILGATASTTQVTPAFSFNAPGGTEGTSGGLDRLSSPRSGVSLGSGPELSRGEIDGIGNIGGTSSLGPAGTSEIPGSFEQSDYRFKGLPLGMVILLLLVAAVVSRYVRRFVDVVIGGAKE